MESFKQWTKGIEKQLGRTLEQREIRFLKWVYDKHWERAVSN